MKMRSTALASVRFGSIGRFLASALPILLEDETEGVFYLEVPVSMYPLEPHRLDTLTVLAAQTLFYTRLSEMLNVNRRTQAIAQARKLKLLDS